MCIALDWAHAAGSADADPDAPCLLLGKVCNRGTSNTVSQPFTGWPRFATMTPQDREDLSLGGWKAFWQRDGWRRDMSRLAQLEPQLMQASQMFEDGLLPAALLEPLGGVKPLAFATADAMLADLKFVLASAFTDPFTLLYSMRKAGLWSEHQQIRSSTNDPQKRSILRAHVVGVELGHELQEILVFRNILGALLGHAGPRLHIELIGCSIPRHQGWDAVADIDESKFTYCITCFIGSYQEFIRHKRYRKPDVVVAYYPGLYDPTCNWLPVLAHLVEQQIPFVLTCASDQDHVETQDMLRSNCLGITPHVLLNARNPFAAALEQHPFDPNVLKARNMYVMLIHGGNLGTIIPEIIQQSPAGERIRAQLKSFKSQRDWDALFHDLLTLWS